MCFVGVWFEVVTWSSAFGVGRQRQQALRVEHVEHDACTDVQRAPGSGQGHRLVAASAWLAGERWRYGRSVHSLLEHAHSTATAVRRHRLASLQSGLVQTLEWTGEWRSLEICSWLCSILLFIATMKTLHNELCVNCVYIVGQHAWIFTESNFGLEVSIPCSNSKTDGPLIPCFVFGKFTF